MDNNEAKEECRMCGKKLSAKDMFRKADSKKGPLYLCCQICYELFTGEHLSGHAGMKYK